MCENKDIHVGGLNEMFQMTASPIKENPESKRCRGTINSMQIRAINSYGLHILNERLAFLMQCQEKGHILNCDPSSCSEGWEQLNGTTEIRK